MQRFYKNKTALLYGGMLFNVVLGYGITKINTAFLSVEVYGMLSLFMNLVLFIRVFFSLGIFESASRLLAIEKNISNAREIFGATLFYTLLLGLLLNLVVFASSFFIDSILEVKIGFLLKILWPLTFVLLLQNMLLIVLRGFGFIKHLSVFYFLSRLIYIIIMAALVYYGIFHLQSTALAFLVSIAIAVLIFSSLLKPSFSGFKKQVKLLYHEILAYGHHLYLANIFSAFFLHIDKLFLAYFLDARQLGYYALAYTITAPMPYFSNAISTTAFRNFARETHIQSRKLWINLIYVSTAVSILLLFNRFIIEVLFSTDFAPARPTLLILTFAFALNALSVPYTMFFKAQKYGKEIKNITLFTQIIFLSANILFIPMWGINGAAIAVLIAYGLDFVLYFVVYQRKFLRIK